jgi:hypothetical protein
MASTPSSLASLRMLSDPTPSRSARATAARRIRSRLKGARGAGLGSVRVTKGSASTGARQATMQAIVQDTYGSADVLDRRFPLAEVPDAVRYLVAGHGPGKVVIAV